MYDARGGGAKSTVIFGTITLVVVGLAFFGVLLMPNGGKASSPVANIAQTENAVLDKLDDSATRNYVMTLARVSPRAADQLDADVTAALADKANKDELAVIVMQSFNEDMLLNIRHLAKADVKHFDAMMASFKIGLRGLSQSRSKYCKGSFYEDLANENPEKIQRMVLSEFSYDSAGYKWGVQMNTQMLEAIEDAKANPVRHGKLNSGDEKAMQTLALRLVTDPQVVKIMSLQGADKATAARAARGLDFCRLGVTGIDAIQSLPADTRGRMWAEGFKQIKSGELEKMLMGFAG